MAKRKTASKTEIKQFLTDLMRSEIDGEKLPTISERIKSADLLCKIDQIYKETADDTTRSPVVIFGSQDLED